MKVTIDLKTGNYNRERVVKSDIQKNIDALQRYIDGKQCCCDDLSLIDTKSILETIQKQLPIR